MRVLDVSDGFTASAAPTTGLLSAGQLSVYASDAAFVLANGAASDGHIYRRSADNNIRVYNGSSWESVPTEGSVAAFTNKDYDGGTATDARRLTLPKATFATLTALTRKAGTVVFSTDRLKAFLDNGTTLIGMGGGGGGSSLIWRLLSNAPTENDSAGLELLDFDYLSSQELWAHIQVPSDYLAGTQIKLVGGLFATSVTTNKVKFKATTYLLRAASTVVGTYSNSYDSTNLEVSAAGVASRITAIGDIDLTGSTGLINAVAVAANDILLVKLIRDTAGESASAAADARFLRYAMAPQFT